MKKIYILLMLASVLSIWCIAGEDKGIDEHEKLQTKFEIDGELVDIGDYQEVEKLFIASFEQSHGTEYELYDVSELTTETLENRNGNTIIERCIGIVTNKNDGSGLLINYDSPSNYYISYQSLGEEVNNGTVVLSYMVYNKDTNYVDDIIERYDFVICREYED